MKSALRGSIDIPSTSTKTELPLVSCFNVPLICFSFRGPCSSRSSISPPKCTWRYYCSNVSLVGWTWQGKISSSSPTFKYSSLIPVPFLSGTFSTHLLWSSVRLPVVLIISSAGPPSALLFLTTPCLSSFAHVFFFWSLPTRPDPQGEEGARGGFSCPI